MSIWILAIVLLLIFGGLGFAKGAIRTTISLIGILLGAALAVPLSGIIRPLMGPIGVVNPVWVAIVPPLVMFLLIYLAFVGISFLVHHKVYLLYKYKHDDVDRIRWERMNRGVGAGVGMLAGSILFLYVCGLIYAAGYLTVQISADDNNPGTIKFINAVRQDMSESGFDKAAARFQPASKLYYEAADVLGLLYHNPLLQSRLATYPYFLSLSQRPDLQELANDKEYNDLIFGRAPVTQIIAHERTQALLNNSELMEYLKGTDLKDLKQYLRTGESPKYADQEILGVWHLDKQAVVTFMRKAKPDIKARELRALRAALESLPTVAMTAMPDGKVVFASGGEAPAQDQQAADQAAANDPLIARYGPEYARSLNRQQGQPAAPQAPPPTPDASLIPKVSGEGTWKEEAGQYILSLPGPTGQPVNAVAKIKADELVLTIGPGALVFYKQ